MKRYALLHIEEELYLNDGPNGYELDSNLYLFTKGELEYIFTNKYDSDEWDVETVVVDNGGSEYTKEDFNLITFTMSRSKDVVNFKDFDL